MADADGDGIPLVSPRCFYDRVLTLLGSRDMRYDQRRRLLRVVALGETTASSL
jgi:hypothetical protein